MRWSWALASIIALASLSPGTADAKPGRTVAAQVQALLTRQAVDWNRGDLAAFCAIYAADATFVSPSGVTRGRDQILDRYRKKYDTAEKRGILTLKVIETRTTARGASTVLEWTIQKQERASGHSLVVLHRTSKGWEIVQDASM